MMILLLVLNSMEREVDIGQIDNPVHTVVIICDGCLVYMRERTMIFK